MHKANFLGVTFNLRNNTYEPYIKPGNRIIYIHKDYNHSKATMRELPKSISKIITDQSSAKEIFEKITPTYSEVLQKLHLMDI